MSKKSKVEEFVLDGSVTLAWYFQDEAHPYADGVAASFPSARAVVPAIWHLEVGNAVLMGERRGRSTEAQAVQWLGYLRALPITVDDETIAHAWDDILSLARPHRLSAYDATYLELALRRSLPLATLDEDLKRAAAAVGIAEYRP